MNERRLDTIAERVASSHEGSARTSGKSEQHRLLDRSWKEWTTRDEAAAVKALNWGAVALVKIIDAGFTVERGNNQILLPRDLIDYAGELHDAGLVIVKDPRRRRELMASDGEGTVNDVQAAKELVAAVKEISAFEFANAKARSKYIKEHPDTDKSKHVVKKNPVVKLPGKKRPVLKLPANHPSKKKRPVLKLPADVRRKLLKKQKGKKSSDMAIELVAAARALTAGRSSRSVSLSKAISVIRANRLVVTSASVGNSFNTRAALAKVKAAAPHGVSADLFDDGAVTFRFGDRFDNDFIEFTTE